MHRVVYFGTPPYAVPSLQALNDDSRFEVQLVVTQPDRPAGRKRVLRPPAVKEAAVELGIETYQPVSLKSRDAREPIRSCEAEVFVVAAYGLLFGRSLLEMAPWGCVNLHASLLPVHRGSSPVAAAILQGDKKTGITLMKMDRGLDTGAILSQVEIPLEGSETTESLTQELGELAGRSLPDELAFYLAGERKPIDQSDTDATVTRKLARDDGWIDWTQPAEVVERHVRAMWSWPRAWTTSGDERLQIHVVTVIHDELENGPGNLKFVDGDALVQCGAGTIRLDRLQPAGGKAIDARSWAHGRSVRPHKLGVGQAPEPREPIVRPVV